MGRRLAIVGVAITLAGCGDAAGGASASGPERVRAADFEFAPTTVHVRAGESVEWANTGRTEHTVKGRGFFSRAIAPGGRFAHRFAGAGTYEYLCTLHPGWMRGKVVVEDG